MTDIPHFPARLLLVDDDPSQIRLWEHVLRRDLGEQIQIEAMSDPHAALTHTLNHGVDILITDLSMPDVCGLDLVRCVKARNKYAQVLLITGTSTTDSLLASIDLGTTDYLLKPLAIETLVELVRQADARLRRWRHAWLQPCATVICNRRCRDVKRLARVSKPSASSGFLPQTPTEEQGA